MRQFNAKDEAAATAKDNLWQQDSEGGWRIDPERDALRMATEGGAMAMRLGLNIGQIAPGFRADICLYRLGGPCWTPVNDPVAQLVFAETGASVAYTLVDGDILVDQGRVTAFDAEGALAEVSGMVASLRRRNADLFSVAHAIAKALP